MRWPFDVAGGSCLSCHTDPISGEDGARLLRESWGWLQGDVEAMAAKARATHQSGGSL